MLANSSAPDNIEQQFMAYGSPLRTWAGHGTGALCNGCATPIKPSEVEYEVEMPRGNSVPSLHFHFVCYRNWTDRGSR